MQQISEDDLLETVQVEKIMVIDTDIDTVIDMGNSLESTSAFILRSTPDLSTCLTLVILLLTL